MGLIAPDGPVYQAGTLSGHALSMAAGIATLEALDADAYLRLERAGQRLEEGLREAARRSSGRSVAITRVGSLLTLFFLDREPVDAADALRADRDAFARFFGAMLDDGVLLPPSPFEAWFLSLAHGDAELDRLVGAADRALAVA
jgi:glutamate-1-semialdehyde 2,1-aminomutase